MSPTDVPAGQGPIGQGPTGQGPTAVAAAASTAPAGPQPLGADGRPVDWTKVYLGFSGLAVGQFMALLDIQIVAAALAEVQAGIGATADEIGWIQSVYLLTEVVAIPVSAYLSKLWGVRPFYMVTTVAFILTSIAVGLSSDIQTMIFNRALQGLAAGAMIPATFAIAMTVFPIEKRLSANVIVSMIVTLAPTIGPTLGGHIAEAMGWRWLFFINIGPGLLVLFLVGRYLDFDRPEPGMAKGIDWWGLGLMTTFLIAMQYVLEEGAENSWFQDDIVLWVAVLTVISGVAFIWRQLVYRQPIVSLAPFQDRNFTLGILITFISGASLYGGTFLLPLFLAHVRGYSAAEVGNVMLVSGLVMFVATPALGRFVRAVDFRFSLGLGMALTAWGMWQGVYVNDQWGFWEFAGMQTARGLGSMVAMIAASQMSVATLPLSMMKDASGLINLIRNVGGAFGIAIISTTLFQTGAAHLQALSQGVSGASLRAQDFLAGMTSRMEELGVADPAGAARKAMGFMIQRDAQVLAYIDAFALVAVGAAIAAAIGFFAAPAGLKAPSAPAAPAARPGGDD
ncbi:DHA2 family efflux MFS transporter permease subunit [Phenylobacterium sp. SCN 70-31]|uniref:DHA2 family efflux MFS transporter permease subunit n=1 Tax=Phenylobacterium sp. SCN 70-31 TaxID=1660129 RepID=UPI000AF0EEC7|nr:DHA2 family efflux MFS transporter permease subunit [Phenylobacterium sp. SCN 70-31]